MTSTGRPGTRRGLGLAAVAMLSLAGCSLDGLLNGDQVPPHITDPAITKTPQGALAVYRGVISRFRAVFGGADGYIVQAGTLADELTSGSTGQGIPDLRVLPPGLILIFDVTSGTYSQRRVDPAVFEGLQRVRGQAGQAIGLLTDYYTDSASVQSSLLSHTYALAGYAELLLAELYCSGVPLSTLDYHGDYTLKPGSSTAEILTHAAAVFDTALGLAGDSSRFVSVAAVGQGRARLGLGDYAGAAAAVAAVPTAYRYEVSYTAVDNFRNFAYKQGVTLWAFSVADHEGINGLDYISSADPRTPVLSDGMVGTYTVYRPGLALYAPTGASPIVLASGVEARLIEAEAALQVHPDDGVWLTTLNALRTDGTQDGGGVYQPGSGGVADLAPLEDPGTASGRVDLVFRERAFWLFLTGHRQGDLRRLIRQYGRSQNAVYPTGTNPRTSQQYGTDVNFPVPEKEQTINLLYTGCISRDA